MARKNLLAGLTDQKLPAGNTEGRPQAEAALHNPSSVASFVTRGGAIGAVSRSIAEIKAQSISEIEPSLIDPSPVVDRLESSSGAHAELVASIRDNGQQVPILVRPHPDKTGRYQIAYGRRRLKAAADLGRKVRAVVKPLTDQELVVAQGQENSARTDLSFIERALFAARLEESGYSRETIMASLSVDKTGLSRLISAAVKIPRDLIEAIGPAPRAGRDRWIELAARLDLSGAIDRARVAISEEGFSDKHTDDRFSRTFAALAVATSKPSTASTWKNSEGAQVASIKKDDRGVTLFIDKKIAGSFGNYLVEALPEIYAAFKRGADVHAYEEQE